MEPKAPDSTAAQSPLAENSVPAVADVPTPAPALAEEFGGNKKLEPTRYGDWEINGKCVDF